MTMMTMMSDGMLMRLNLVGAPFAFSFFLIIFCPTASAIGGRAILAGG